MGKKQESVTEVESVADDSVGVASEPDVALAEAGEADANVQDPGAQDAAGPGAGAGEQPQPGQDDGNSELEVLQQQLAEAREQALRAAAEMQNVRRRAERDVENAHKYGQEKLISALLPVLDNLDRALDAARQTSNSADNSAATGAGEDGQSAVAESLKPIIEGVELTRKSALDALKQFSVEVLEPYGEPFDPQVHEAMTMIESDSAEPNTVIDVLQKGYRLNGRLLRAAMVVVARA